MESPLIRHFTIRDLLENKDEIDRLDDPRGYLLSCNDSWIELLNSNPYSQPDDIALILALDRNTVIGRLGFYAGLVSLQGDKDRCFWMSGFFLDESYKKAAGIGGKIILTALTFMNCLLASGGPDLKAQRLYSAVGLKELGPLRRFVYFYNVEVILRKFCTNRYLIKLLSVLPGVLLKTYYRFKSLFCRRNYLLNYRRVESFDSNLDLLVADEKRNHFPKDSTFLNWILSNREASAFEIYDKQNLIGYCLLSKSHRQGGGKHRLPLMNVGCLLDFYLANESRNIKEDLITFSMQFFRGKKVDLFECQIHDSAMAEICRKYGFIQMGGNKVMFKPKPGQILIPDRSWCLTFGTSDVILYS